MKTEGVSFIRPLDRIVFAASILIAMLLRSIRTVETSPTRRVLRNQCALHIGRTPCFGVDHVIVIGKLS